jgi:outer membrane protein
MRSLRLIALLAIPAQFALAQQPTPTISGELSLDDAIRAAQQNNPQYLQARNNLRNTEAQVKQTRGALLPSLSAQAGSRYTQAGTQYQFGLAFPTQGSYNSYYQLSASYNISAGLLYAPKAASASNRAAEATIASNSEMVRSTVTQQYISALENEAQAAVMDTLVQVAQGQLDLANAKMAAGAGTIIDVRTAEVAVGQAQVNALTAHNTARLTKLQLFQTMGLPGDPDTKLTSTFAVSQPNFTLDSLLDLARRVNPDLAAKKAVLGAGNANVSYQRTSYLPSLSFSTGYSANALGYSDPNYLANQAISSQARGFASCMLTDSLRVGAGLSPMGNCGSPTLTPDQIAHARSLNQPLKFTSSPPSFQVYLQYPIFNGFQRETNVEQAEVTRDNAALDLRSRNLQLTTDVTQAYLTLVTSAKTAQLQEQNAAKAAEDLALNEQSYKVGAKTFLDVATARATYEQQEVARVNAIYDYQKAFAALENAVGRPLR